MLDHVDWNATVHDFIQNNDWNIPKLSSVTDKDIGNKILAIPLPIHDQDDELIWGPAANG